MACGTWRGFRKTALRRKAYNPGSVEDTLLRRCLSRWELTALGVGSTLGAGVYVLVGHVALSLAGPSIVLSFLVAGVAALLAGLCFAEFSTRIPKAGAAYNYTYLALGEMVAFLIGWCNILECVFGSASVAKGLSIHMDAIFNGSITSWFSTTVPISVPFMSTYFDFIAFFVVLVMGGVLSFGVREVSLINQLFSAVNMAVIVFIVALGAFKADSGNWSIPLESVPADHGMGGFFPFGVWGTLRGAAVCFYGFVGFDSICAAGEEARSPRQVIPLTIVLVILVTLLCYSSVAIVITMMVPYYLQGPHAAISDAFVSVGWNWARWIVCLGSLFGLYASLFGAMFPLPRLLYSMSSDGLLVKCFSKLTELRKSPMIATLIPTVFIAILAGSFDVKFLVATMCIGTLFSYTAVAASVIVMRYRSDYTPGGAKYFRQLFGIGRSPTLTSARIIYVSLIIFICTGIAAALVLTHAESSLIPASVLHGVALALVLVMSLQPQVKEELPFKTPLVPLMPCLSIYFNIHLMVIISGDTWIRAGVWIALGVIIYLMKFCCCKREESHLKENITIVHTSENGKGPVQIIVESPTPPDTIARTSNYGGDTILEEDEIQEDIQQNVVRNIVPVKTEEIILHQAYIEESDEKEAKIIDLLDQMLQAEEDTYGEVNSLKEVKEDDAVATSQETAVHRKSLSELSDAGSDASLGNPGLSKYDVIVQVHREDLPKLNEEEEKSEREEENDREDIIDHEDDEQVTAFNDSDSRTDESGYSDTIDRNTLIESLEESKEDLPNIPVPPPLPDQLILSANFKKSYTIASKHSTPSPYIPPVDYDDEQGHRESIKSNSTTGEDNITFGSDRQVNFMSKLNNLFQTKITSSDDEEPRRRSHSTGNAVEVDFPPNNQRPLMFIALQNEITSKEAALKLRPVNAEEKPEPEEEDFCLTRQDLKNKLEGIFAAGGPQLLKPRLMKSNPPTPEDSYQTDASSTESIPKLPKMDKNDTLKRQKDKFSEVLNSFRLSIRDDDV